MTHHATYEKFGGDEMLIRAYEHWSVLCRPAQATKGSMVLVAKSDALAFAALPAAAFSELHEIIGAIEATQAVTFAPDKMNYLMLMMVDPHVHYHVIPRYGPDHDLEDPGWPGPPALAQTVDADAATVRDTLKAAWSEPTTGS
ncbi:MAG: HIT family protein [Pseudomonadota bacterium]